MESSTAFSVSSGARVFIAEVDHKVSFLNGWSYRNECNNRRYWDSPHRVFDSCIPVGVSLEVVLSFEFVVDRGRMMILEYCQWFPALGATLRVFVAKSVPFCAWMAPGAAMETAVCDGHLRFLNVLLQQHVRVLPEEYQKIGFLWRRLQEKTYPYSAPCSGDKFPRQYTVASGRISSGDVENQSELEPRRR